MHDVVQKICVCVYIRIGGTFSWKPDEIDELKHLHYIFAADGLYPCMFLSSTRVAGEVLSYSCINFKISFHVVAVIYDEDLTKALFKTIKALCKCATELTTVYISLEKRYIAIINVTTACHQTYKLHRQSLLFLLSVFL